MEPSANATAATGRTNRLIHEQSPYLLQHAHNPVDWYAWGEEAFAAAAAQDKPIFLSLGYSTCHWCHVMERESFEDAQVAELLNRDFIAIKVDREERPEIDDLYMSATQMLTGQGGWPNSLWLAAWGCLLAFGGLLAQRSQGVETLTLALAAFLDRCPAEIQKECQDQRPQAAAQVVSGPVRLEVFSPAGALRPGERVELELRMTIGPPWHVASHDASSEDNVPTEVTLDANPMATLGELEYPPGVFAQLAQSDKPVSIYQGSVVFRLPLAISPQAKAGPLELAVQVRFQACDDRSCQKPTQIRAGFSVKVG